MDSKEKMRGWLLPDAKGGTLSPGLYLVATPIGNMGDISLRALDTLAAADGVLCEDTRVSGKLLKYFNLKKSLSVYNDHSDERARQKIVECIRAGEALVLMSDAGMPLISDPGYKLVCALREEGLNVTSVPGANAPLAALQLSGLASDRFSFIGFLPSKSGARKNLLEEWVGVPGTLIAFETAPRLVAALGDIGEVMQGRRVVVARELTKLYEEVRSGTPEELIAHYKEHGAPKGEIVLVIEAPKAVEYSQEELEGLVEKALEAMSTKDASGFVAAQTGRSKKELYDLALAISKRPSK